MLNGSLFFCHLIFMGSLNNPHSNNYQHADHNNNRLINILLHFLYSLCNNILYIHYYSIQSKIRTLPKY
nr:MAG TPA: hypothetical protein [Caudoviricetes sp.]